MKLLFIPILTITFLLGSCNYIPCSSSSDLSSISEIPKLSLIAGIYKPDKFTKQDFREYSNADSVMLILTEDNKIVLKNFPIETFDIFNTSHKTVNGSGTWTFGSQSGKINIDTKISFDQPGIVQQPPFKLFKKSDKYYVLIDFGDPDVCSSVRLEQQ